MEAIEEIRVGSVSDIKVTLGPMCVDGQNDQFDMIFVDSVLDSLTQISDEEFSRRCQRVYAKVATVPIKQTIEWPIAAHVLELATAM